MGNQSSESYPVNTSNGARAIKSATTDDIFANRDNGTKRVGIPPRPASEPHISETGAGKSDAVKLTDPSLLQERPLTREEADRAIASARKQSFTSTLLQAMKRSSTSMREYDRPEDYCTTTNGSSHKAKTAKTEMGSNDPAWLGAAENIDVDVGVISATAVQVHRPRGKYDYDSMRSRVNSNSNSRVNRDNSNNAKDEDDDDYSGDDMMKFYSLLVFSVLL